MNDDSTSDLHDRMAEANERILALEDALQSSERQREVLENVCFGLETEYAEAQEALKAAQLELEESYHKAQEQKRELQVIGAPILAVAEGIVALPIIGTVDQQRAHDLTEKLLAYVSENSCRWVILDLTGVENVDSAITHHLVRVLLATQLLGSRCVVTGIRPGVASTMVSLDIELGKVPTLRNLRDGIEWCVRLMAAAESR